MTQKRQIGFLIHNELLNFIDKGAKLDNRTRAGFFRYSAIKRANELINNNEVGKDGEDDIKS